jgi:LysM repeat protein
LNKYKEEIKMKKKFSVFLCFLMISVVCLGSLNIKADELSVNKGNSNISHLKYTVRAGDTLWGISHRLGVSIYVIKAMNGLHSNNIYVGQILTISYRNPVNTVNYRVGAGETIWGLAQKYHTSTASIIKSNYMKVDYFMPRQIVTIPLYSTRIVRPIRINMLRKKSNMYYGDIYTWDNVRRLFTVGTTAIVKDLATGRRWNIKYYGGSNHADIVTLTKTDTNIMYKTFGYKWSWSNKRPVVVNFTQGGIKYQIAASLIGMPHSTDNVKDNGMVGHCCLYFYNSVGHSSTKIDPVSQSNIIRASGQ